MLKKDVLFIICLFTCAFYIWTNKWWGSQKILCEVPANMLLQNFGARKWLATTMLLSAIILALIGSTVRNGEGLIAGRFFLGCVQAAVFPWVII